MNGIEYDGWDGGTLIKTTIQIKRLRRNEGLLYVVYFLVKHVLYKISANLCF